MGKLPKVYVNKKSNKVVNNEEIFYSKDDNTHNNTLNYSNSIVNSLIIHKKINDIFNSPNFVYKVNVMVTTKDEGEKELVLIAKTSDHVLTIDNKVILIDDILKIYEK